MAVIEEGSLIIEIPDALSFKKFDDGKSHGLSHCMKAVDFIVETKDRIIFIEIKDPPPTGKNTAKFIEELQSGRLDETLKYKYRDSFLYEWASEKINKPVYYYVIIALDKLDPASLLFRTDELKRKPPFLLPYGSAKLFIHAQYLISNRGIRHSEIRNIKSEESKHKQMPYHIEFFFVQFDFSCPYTLNFDDVFFKDYINIYKHNNI